MKKADLRSPLIKNPFAGLGWYLLPLDLCWLLLGFLLVLYGNKTSFSLLNSYPSPASDRLLYYLTELSSGIVLISIFILALCRSRPVETILGVIAIFIAWYFCIILKYNVFAGWKSPETKLGAAHIHLLKSHLQPELDFPSAHATVIAALNTFLAWFYRHTPGKVVLFLLINIFLTLLPVFAGWSFPGDILAGNILGTVSCLLSIRWLHAFVERWYNHLTIWWQDIIIAIFRTTAICLLLFSFKYFAL